MRSSVCCRQESAIFYPLIHGTWAPWISRSLYCTSPLDNCSPLAKDNPLLLCLPSTSPRDGGVFCTHDDDFEGGGGGEGQFAGPSPAWNLALPLSANAYQSERRRRTFSPSCSSQERRCCCCPFGLRVRAESDSWIETQTTSGTRLCEMVGDRKKKREMSR